MARDYELAGAAAISVLTDRHFKGSLEDLRGVRAADRSAAPAQGFHFRRLTRFIRRARLYADCILLIAAMLKASPTWHALYAAARELGLQALVEVHNRGGITRQPIAMAAEIVGINNRDLHTFVTDDRGHRAAAQGLSSWLSRCGAGGLGKRHRYARRYPPASTAPDARAFLIEVRACCGTAIRAASSRRSQPR